MRTNDTNTLMQGRLKKTTNILSTGVQFTGLYYGNVVQTDATAPGPITKGNMTITIPALSGTEVWGPIPYPGSVPPPAKTVCVVSFANNNQPIAIAFYGFTPGILLYGSGVPSSSLGNIGDNYIDITNHKIYGPKVKTGWGSGSNFDIEPPDIDV